MRGLLAPSETFNCLASIRRLVLGCIYRASGDTLCDFSRREKYFRENIHARQPLYLTHLIHNIQETTFLDTDLQEQAHPPTHFVNEENHLALPVGSPSDSPVLPKTSSQKVQTPSQQAKKSSSNPLLHHPSFVTVEQAQDSAQETLQSPLPDL